MAHLANNLRGQTTECTNKVLRTAWEMYVRLFQTPLLLKNEKSINNQSKREQKPQNCLYMESLIRRLAFPRRRC